MGWPSQVNGGHTPSQVQDVFVYITEQMYLRGTCEQPLIDYG